MLFVGYQRAFDSLRRAWIWDELKVRGLSSKFINIIKEGYEDFSCTVLHEGQLSDSIKTSTGVRQGCLLSPLLFMMVMDGVLRRALDGKKRGLTWRVQESFEDMEYADDVCLVSHKYEHMCRKLHDIWKESKDGLEINSSKTEEIRVNTTVKQGLRLNGQDIKRSSDFCYLGSIVAENEGTSREVNARIQKARGSFSKLRRVWLSKSLRIDTKIRIFNACVKSVLLYGCETWLVTKEIQCKIQTFVNRCLRYILRIWWPNIISNKDLWKVTEQEDINLEIRKRKFRWIGHTLRKEEGEIPKAALLWNPQGNRKRGRPRNGWRRSVIKEEGRSWNELRFLAADRQKWKGLIDNLCS